MSSLLAHDAFLSVVRDTPLVSIDLIVYDERGHVLLGLRRNAPAQGFWFVPGGRIRKNEPLDIAFSRLALEELGLVLSRNQAGWKGLYEHFYSDCFDVASGISTHYVVLAHVLTVHRNTLKAPESQHSDYRWVAVDDLLADACVHENTRAYFC
jgi:colanic acid biosynthesis protein WcaH